MTAPEPEYEWGVEWTYHDGTTNVATGYSESGARATLDRCSSAHNSPHATRLMRRPVAEWLPVPQEPGTATQATK